MPSLTPIYELADDFAKNTARSVFITGKAGTGKTTFLRRLKESCPKQTAVVAPTGVAAINAGGVTMHSFFQLPFTPFLPTPEGKRALLSKHRMNGARRRVLRELELLVIDEVSMVRADVLDEIDTLLRHYRYRNSEAFGGVQVVYIGDLYQLSPVAQDEEWKWLSPYYATPYFFDSQVVRQNPPLYLEFDRIFRQKHSDFIQLLNEVRNNMLSEEGAQMLHACYQPGFNPSEHQDYITLTTHNQRADAINDREMAKLKGPLFRYTATVKGIFPEKNYPNDAELELKEGAKVMFISNDPSPMRHFYNGKMGRVVALDTDELWVLCDGEKEAVLVPKDVWFNIRYQVNPSTKQIEEEELGSYTQYPLRLAWAITIHKSQGLTFDKVVIDAESAFAFGQVYVALSRCTSLKGVKLLTPIYRSSLAVDQKVKNYSVSSKRTIEELNANLDNSKRLYKRKIMLQLYDLQLCSGLAESLYADVMESEIAFNGECLPFLQSLKENLQQLEKVARTFRHQLQVLFAEEDESKWKQRMQDASAYFVKQLKEVVEQLEHSPVQTEDEQLAKEYAESVRMLHAEVCQKIYLLERMRPKDGADRYYSLKQLFKVPKCPVNAYVDPYAEIEKRERELASRKKKRGSEDKKEARKRKKAEKKEKEC